MNNQQLESKIKNLLTIDNFFDMVEQVYAFEKEYKKTNFYARTKMPLAAVIKESKIWYSLQLNDLENKIQRMINDLDLTKLTSLLNQLGEVFGAENEEIIDTIKLFKEIAA